MTEVQQEPTPRVCFREVSVLTRCLLAVFTYVCIGWHKNRPEWVGHHHSLLSLLLQLLHVWPPLPHLQHSTNLVPSAWEARRNLLHCTETSPVWRGKVKATATGSYSKQRRGSLGGQWTLWCSRLSLQGGRCVLSFYWWLRDLRGRTYSYVDAWLILSTHHLLSGLNLSPFPPVNWLTNV